MIKNVKTHLQSLNRLPALIRCRAFRFLRNLRCLHRSITNPLPSCFPIEFALRTPPRCHLADKLKLLCLWASLRHRRIRQRLRTTNCSSTKRCSRGRFGAAQMDRQVMMRSERKKNNKKNCGQQLKRAGMINGFNIPTLQVTN